MKRRPMLSIIAILLAALLLASCNADAQDGIFSAIADSTQDSGTKVKAYLGSAKVNGKVYYYVLTDSAVIRLGSGADPFTTINSTKDALLVGAALVDNDGGDKSGIYVHVSKSGSSDPSDSRILKYGLDGELDESYTAVTNVKWITTNGVYYTENGTDYKMGFVAYASATTLEVKRIVGVFESEDYVLVSFDDGKINIYYRTGTNPYNETAGKTNIVGFQAIDKTIPCNEFLVVVKNGSRYDVHTLVPDSDSKLVLSEAVASLKSTFSSGNVIHSFYYQTGSGNYAVFKTDNYFDQLEIETYTMTTLNTAGYASKLRTSLVVNILPFGSSGNFIVATYSNSIWKINATSEDDPVEIK